jgi:hypothetical protein
MAMKGEDFSADRMAIEYLNYLFRERPNARHVRRVLVGLADSRYREGQGSLVGLPQTVALLRGREEAV